MHTRNFRYRQTNRACIRPSYRYPPTNRTYTTQAIVIPKQTAPIQPKLSLSPNKPYLHNRSHRYPQTNHTYKTQALVIPKPYTSSRYPQTNHTYTTQTITVLKQTVPLGLYEDKQVCTSWLH